MNTLIRNSKGKFILFILLVSILFNTVYAWCDEDWDFIFEFPQMLYEDSDGDWPKDVSEITNWTDPCIDNYKYREVDWISELWWTWDLITVDIPWNLSNIDIENSGFMVFATGWTLTQFDQWIPTETWYWLNDSQENSRIKGRMIPWDNNTEIDWSSNWSLTTLWSQVWPNTLSINVSTDSYYPFLFLKIVDFAYWDPSSGFTKYIYMWELFVDTTAPICSIILKWWAHEQRDNEWIENLWYSTWAAYMTTMSLTWSGPDISSYTWSSFSLSPYITANYSNQFLRVDNKIWEVLVNNFSDTIEPINNTTFTSYNWNYIQTNSWYIPWSKSGVYFVDSYKDNLSWLHYSKKSILDSNLAATYTENFRWNQLDSINGSVTWNLSRISNIDQSFKLENNKVIHVKIIDRAWNESVCHSQISKYDVDNPSVAFTGFKDYVGSDFWEFWVGHLELNRWANITLSLMDNKTWCQPDWTLCDEVDQWVSSFKPSDFDVGNYKMYYCWIWKPGDCKWKDEYLYSETWSHSSGVFVAWTWDLPVPWWVFIEEDAYFVRDRVKEKADWWYLESWTWSQFGEVLVSKEWLFLSTEEWFIKFKNSDSWLLTTKVNLRSTWFVAIEYNNWHEYYTWAYMTWNIAFKLYAKTLSEGWVEPDDFFYVDIPFKDRAWNGDNQYFEVKRRMLAKILGNVQVKATEAIDDPVVQEFTKDKETVDENIARVKQNIKSDVVSKQDSNGDPMYVSSSDLSLLDNKYKIDLWDEILYIVRNWDIVFWSWSLDFSTSNEWKNITFVTYWWNVFINSSHISSDKDVAIVSLIDPSLANEWSSTWKNIESQWNILISPYLLAIKSHLIAEWSLFSYAYTSWVPEPKIEIIFSFESRKSIFRNQLFIDGLIMSKNTIGWYGHSPKTCPQDIYWVDNTCYILDNWDQDNTDSISSLSLMYDLHYLRMFVWNDDSPQAVIDNDMNISEIHSAMRTKKEFNTILNKFIPIVDHFTLVDENTTISWEIVLNSDFVDNLKNSENLRQTVGKLKDLKVYPIVIKNVVPNRSMKIFGSVSN